MESNYSCGEYDNLKKCLKTQLKEKGYELYSPTKTAGSMCYNPSIFPESCLLHVYRFLTLRERAREEQVQAVLSQICDYSPVSIRIGQVLFKLTSFNNP